MHQPDAAPPFDPAFAWAAPLLAPGAEVHGAGNYNRNIIATHAGSPVIIRVPIAGAAPLDMRVLPEPDVLRLVASQGFPAPRLIHADLAGRFAVHSFVPGERLDHRFPVRAPLPDWVADDLAAQLASLHDLDPAPLAAASAAAVGERSADLLGAAAAFTRGCYERLARRHRWLYERLRVPHDPLAAVLRGAGQLGDAPRALCHGDVHRRNLIVAPGAERLTIIDWELALVGDPAFDLAVHLHRTRYADAQERRFLARYLGLRREEAQAERLSARVAIFRRHEQVRSALIDVARTVEDVRVEQAPEVRDLLANHYAIKLRQAWRIWGVEEDPRLLEPEGLLAVLDEAAARTA